MKRLGRRRATILSGVFACLALLVVFLGPGSFSVWSEQRKQTTELNAKIAALNTANDEMAAQVKRLQKPGAIKEIARSEYGMVPKGARAYAILPAPTPDARPQGTWPFLSLESTSPSRSGQ